MAVRIRANRKTIVCAAKSVEMPGDYYLDDVVHEALGVNGLGVLQVIGRDKNEAELWGFTGQAEIERLGKIAGDEADKGMDLQKQRDKAQQREERLRCEVEALKANPPFKFRCPKCRGKGLVKKNYYIGHEYIVCERCKGLGEIVSRDYTIEEATT